MSLCDWTMHIYGNSITITHCHTTMQFLLAWLIANPTQQLCCRCSHIFMCNCFVSALSGFPFLRRCSSLFLRVKFCLYHIYQLKIGPVSITSIDLQLLARYYRTLDTQGITVTILIFIYFLQLMLVLSSY